MERIKEAIQLAREERGGSLDRSKNTMDAPHVFQASERYSRAAQAKMETSNNSQYLEEKADIQYSQTKSVDVPPWVLKKNRVVGADIHAPEMADIKLLRTQVLQGMTQNNYKTLAVVSATPGEGKTLSAINLAYSIAMEAHHTALLVDLDLRNPGVHQYFDYEPDFGIADYFYNDVPLEKIMFSPNSDGLVVLPGRERVEQSSELLSSRRLINLVNELKNRYPNRIVLFDLPPLLVSDDVLAFSPYVDSALMIVEHAKVKQKQLQQALELLKGTPVLGSVLNKSGKSKQYQY